VTVCIAAACEQGRRVVTATDGMLSYGELAADVTAPKMMWFGPWQFLFAGELGEADLVMEEIRLLIARKPAALSRENIQSTVRTAYKRRLGQWCADRVLSPYDLELNEFKRRGKSIFPEHVHDELSKQIASEAVHFSAEILVVGWGKSDAALMLYSVNRYGAYSHSFEGVAALGTGASVALSTLLLLGHNRNSSFQDALYAVAAAKFSAEKCHGVGESTMMFVGKKTPPEEVSEDPTGCMLQPVEIERLRDFWNQYGKPKIPALHISQLDALSDGIAVKLGLTQQQAVEKLVRDVNQAISRKSKRKQ
jgi:hypothetical protein